MADFYDTTTWAERWYYQTGGTRSKVIVENPDNNEEYYFKTSLKRDQKDYKYEFWSEIIASEVGVILGFDMLKYDIAYNRGEIGCISKSMVTMGKNKLTEGISYLTGYDTTYNPKMKDSKKQYTFQLISKTLNAFNFHHYIEKIIEIIILDSIIGNGDRHQENWGIITEYSDVIKKRNLFSKKEKKGLFKKHYYSFFGSKTITPGKFSQIYDSGSCLGRELDDEKIKQMIKDQTMLDAYIRRGVSEIHWKGEKLNHFDLINEINKLYPEHVKRIVQRVKERYAEVSVRNCVENIDLNLPEELKEHKLPTDRKEFVIKLIALRVQKLITFI